MYQQHSRRSRGGAHRGNRGAPGRSGRGGFRLPMRGRTQTGGHPRGNRRGKAPQSQIDIARLINKAEVVETAEVFVPQHHFADFAIDANLKRNITGKGYETPTPIQDKAIPHVLEGRDVVGIANTGTGKTAAFLIPLINKVLHDRTQRVLIMVPTRELAQQIEEEYWGFAAHMRIGAVSVVGGANINPQIAQLRRKPNFVIGTPGRIKDVIERRALDLAHFQTVVLDEADRMLDMGFIQDMRFLMQMMPTERHTLFFSATLSREIEGLIHQFLNDPIRVSVKTGDTAKTVEQDVVRIGDANKVDVLEGLLKQPAFAKVIVFGRTKHGVEKLGKMLRQRGIAAESIHGNKSQNQRQKALEQFKQHKAQVLVATDVAARGIDVSDVSHVINFDLPNTYEDYVHRIGRTGRAGKGGIALSFV